MSLRFGFVIAGLLCFASSLTWAGNWPQFRGVNADGVIEDRMPVTWDGDENIRWKFATEGEGWSAPVVWEDNLFITAAVMKQQPTGGNQRGGRYRGRDLMSAVYSWEVYCLDLDTGEVKWKRVANEGKPSVSRHASNTYASETPVTDGERLYAYFGMTGLYCYDFQGELVWEKDLGSYDMQGGWGTSSSPVLLDDRLFLQVDNNEQSFLVALDTKTGEEAWRVNRDEISQWSTPVIWRHSQGVELVTVGRHCKSYDPKTGKLLWSLDLNGGRSSATPLATGDRLYVGSELRSTGGPDEGGGYLFAINAGATGDITPARGSSSSEGVAWTCPRAGIQMASPVLCQGHLYVLERRSGMLHCINAETGEKAYQQRVPGARAFWSSPWVYEDKVFCLDDTGTTHVVEGGPKFNVLAKNSINEQFWSTPAVANGMLIMRGADHLYCIAE